ncbi:autotransporter assembly complex protein TamA [Lentisalinibacter salinarum]|uniref:autotransporter assembly complex protein TamA n=1 Tax=Lentisalinibacter salinarum TaxID=2992239 RepID=UPI003869CA95
MAAAVAPAARAELLIEGIEGELLANARSFAGLSDEPCDAPAWRVRRGFRNLDQEITDALRALGYYGPTFEKTLDLEREDCWLATVVVDAGPRTRYREVDVRIGGAAEEDPAFLAEAREGRPREGEPLHHGEYAAYKDRLRIAAAERGYVEAEFTAARIDVWPEQQAADVTLHFASGPRYRVGEITVEQDFLEPGLVRGFLDLQEGVPYDAALVSDAYQAMLTSGYFRSVRIEPDLSVSPDHRIPVTVRLTPATRIEYNVGVGASTDGGLRLRGGYENMRVNDRGHRLRAELLASDVESYLTASYRLPVGDPTVEWLSYNAGLRNEDTDTSETDSATFGVKRVTKLGGDWLRTEGLELGYWDYQVSTDSDDSVLVLPSLAFSRARFDWDVNPRRGYSVGVEARGTHRAIGSSTSFLQFSGYFRFVHPLGPKGKLIAGTELGLTMKSELDELPPEFRFFAGGDSSVRGYGYQTLGPTDEEGNVVGGTRLATVRLEYAHDLFGNFAGAVFVDAGNAFDQLEWSPSVGAGIGLRWRSPVGPLRVYLAHPFDDPGRSVRLHITLGPDL